jgi:hypothetical protein
MIQVNSIPSLDMEAGMFGAASGRDVAGVVCVGVGIVVGVVAGIIAH